MLNPYQSSRASGMLAANESKFMFFSTDHNSRMVATQPLAIPAERGSLKTCIS